MFIHHLISIPGTKRIKYLEENVGASDILLDRDEIDRLEEILPLGGAAGTRYEADFKGNPDAIS